MKVLLILLAVLGLSSAGYVRTKLPPTRLQQKLQQQQTTAAPIPPAPQQPSTVTIKVHTYGPAASEKNAEVEQPAVEEHGYEAPAAPQEKQPVEPEYQEPEVEVKTPVRNYDYVKHRDGFAVPPKVTKLQRRPQQQVLVQSQPQEQHFEEQPERTPEQQLEDERAVLEANKNAKYNFATAVDDGIMDQSQVRQETRDGLKVTGSYKYSDGFVRRIVTYEADENGYRVVSEHTEPIGEGPQIDMVNGKADIHTMVHGVDTQYSVNAEEITYHSQSTTTTTTTTTEAPASPVRKAVKLTRLQPPPASTYQTQKSVPAKPEYYHHKEAEEIVEEAMEEQY